MTDDWNRPDPRDRSDRGGWWRRGRGRGRDGGRRGDQQQQTGGRDGTGQDTGQQQWPGQQGQQGRAGGRDPWAQQTGTADMPPDVTTPATTTPAAAGTAARGRTAGYNEGNPGTCVFYALDRFHQVTGVYPYAFGDALLLADGAAASGWTVSTTPRTGTVAIFQPGQNGATAPTGHAAWVEQVTTAGQIYVSEWNAPTPFVVTRRWLTPDRGVRYIYT